jgi:hypothetical protein
MEITEANKAKIKERFFAQYWDQYVLYDIRDKQREVKQPLACFDELVSLCEDTKYFTALLTSLADITDEHAIEVAKRLNNAAFISHKKWKVEHVENGCASYVKVWSKLSYHEFEIDYDGVGLHLIDSETKESPTTHDADTLFAYDYLRSKGYALPFNGLSVEDQIKEGFAKLKTR